MNRRLRALFGVSTVLGAGVIFIAPAASSADVAVPIDRVGLYAEYQYLSRDAAAYQLDVMDQTGAAEPDFAKSLGNRFAGVVAVHHPEFHVMVLVTDAASADTVQTVAEKWGLAEVIQFKVVERSLSRLEADVEETARALKGNADVGTDILNNSITIDVTSTDSLSAPIPNYARVNIVPELGRPTTDIYGGATITGCTSGFNVNKGGGNGLTTAGHCGNTQAWGANNLPFAAEKFEKSHDEQWHSSGQLAVPNRIWVNGNGGWITITSRTFRSSQVIGNWYCKYGDNTDAGCGELDDKTWCPNWVPNCNSTFMKLTHDGVDLASGGDSGGPVYSANSALGTISGETWNVHSFCYCNVVYTAINYVENGLDVVVKTAP